MRDGQDLIEQPGIGIVPKCWACTGLKPDEIRRLKAGFAAIAVDPFGLARRTESIQMRLTLEEKGRMQAAARHRALDVSAYIRGVVMRDADAMLGKPEL